jgi:hypothetical protein
MLAMRLCGNGDCTIPIGPTHLRAFIVWGRTILGAIVVVLVVVWLVCTENLNPDVMVMKSAKDCV